MGYPSEETFRAARSKHLSLEIDNIESEIRLERLRQDQKWGEQNHPDGTGMGGSGDDAAYARAQCQDAAAGGYCTWEMILREEFFEAMAETEPTKLREELVQCAAVIKQWIECIDRRNSPNAYIGDKNDG